jgi:hypothetical protein
MLAGPMRWRAFPERLDDYLDEDNPVRAIDVFIAAVFGHHNYLPLFRTDNIFAPEPNLDPIIARNCRTAPHCRG